MFLNQVKNIFASTTQMLHPQHMFSRLATEETSQETMFQQQCFSNNVSQFSQALNGNS